MRTCVCGCQAERSARLLAAARRAFTFFLADGDAVSDGGRVRDIRRTATPPPSSCSCSISSISTARISARGRGSSARRSLLLRTALLSSKIIACRPAQSAVLPMTRLRRIPPCVIMRSTAAGQTRVWSLYRGMVVGGGLSSDPGGKMDITMVLTSPARFG